MATVFKSKPAKVKFISNRKTIDELNGEYLAKFRADQQCYSKYVNELHEIKRKLANVPKNSQEEMNLDSRKAWLVATIKQLQKNDDEMEYHCRTEMIISQYYTTTEGKYYGVAKTSNNQQYDKSECNDDLASDLQFSSRLTELHEQSKKKTESSRKLLKKETLILKNNQCNQFWDILEKVIVNNQVVVLKQLQTFQKHHLMNHT